MCKPALSKPQTSLTSGAVTIDELSLFVKAPNSIPNLRCDFGSKHADGVLNHRPIPSAADSIQHRGRVRKKQCFTYAKTMTSASSRVPSLKTMPFASRWSTSTPLLTLIFPSMIDWQQPVSSTAHGKVVSSLEQEPKSETHWIH
jgi:hypothetical protein